MKQQGNSFDRGIYDDRARAEGVGKVHRRLCDPESQPIMTPMESGSRLKRLKSFHRSVRQRRANVGWTNYLWLRRAWLCANFLASSRLERKLISGLTKLNE